MESKKGINMFFVLFAFIFGLTLFSHFDFKNFTFKEPVLDAVYIIAFIGSIYLIYKDYKKRQ